MSLFDRFWISARRVRGRLVESILVILATAVGVALVAAMAAFIRSYNAQTEELLSHPAYRELIVETVGNETELSESVSAFDAELTTEATVGLDDIALALQSASLVTYGYVADRTTLSTELFGGPGGGGLGGGAGLGRSQGDAPAPEGDTPVLEGDAPATESDTGEGGIGDPELRFTPAQREVDTAEFDREQFFAVGDDVLTELPLASFPGMRTTPEYFDAFGLEVAEGTLFTVEDVEQGNRTLVLGSALATTLFPDGDAIGTKVRLGTDTYVVVGILEPNGLTDPADSTSLNIMGFVPSPDAQVEFGGNTVRGFQGTRTLHFTVAESSTLEAAAEQLQIHFDTEYGEGSVRITAPIEELSAERETLSRILAVVLFLAAAGLFIASINLFNLMLMRVIKRTKGIGITRAIGASRRDIFRQFLNESAFMSLVGAAIGLVASPIVYNMLQSALISGASASSVAYWPYLIIGALAALVFSILFGVYPAGQAGRIDSAVAVRTE